MADAWHEHQRRQLPLPRPRCKLVPLETQLALPRLALFVSSGRRWRTEKLARACWLAASLAAIAAAMVFGAWR